MQQLRDSAVEKRLEAVRRLSTVPEFPEDLFVTALGDPDWRVRKEAISQFLKAPDNLHRTEFLVAQLGHPENAGLRNAAIEILVGLGATVIPGLIRCLAAVDAEVRKFIVDILGEIGHSSCVAALLPYLRDDDLNVRYAVVETFGKLKAENAVSPLLDLLEEADIGLRFTILETLGSIGVGVPVDRIIPYSEDRLLRKAVFSCLGKLGNPQALQVLVDGVADPLRKTREAALLAIGDLIKTLPLEVSLPPLVMQQGDFASLICEYLDQEEVALRRAACYAICLKPDRNMLQQALQLLAEEELRDALIAAFWRLPGEILNSLLDGIEASNEEAPALVFLFGELRCKIVIPLAMAGLSSADPELRYVSVRTLGKVAAQDAIPKLGDLLRDADFDTREAAAEALRELSSAAPNAVVDTLGPFLASEDAELRLLAIRILAALPAGKVEDKLLLALKDVASEVRCEALRSLKGNASGQLLSGLSLALTDEVADVRRLAAEALAHYQPDRVLPILAAAADDPDPWVRMAAIRAVPGGDEQQVEAMVAKGADDKVGLVAIAALETAARLLPKQASGFLMTALENPDQDVLATAVRILLQEDRIEALLSHDSARVRLAAVREIERRQEASWTALFTERLASESDHEVRAALATALRRGQAGT